MCNSRNHTILAAILVVCVSLPSPAAGQEWYDHGDPTDLEQLKLELVNRARAHPGAEAARLGVDLNHGLPAGTIQNTPKQPLAFHPALLQAARGHSQWMLDTKSFSHTGENGSTASQRVQEAGYELTGTWATSENISWDGTTGRIDPVAFTISNYENLFKSAGHRLNILNDTFAESGVGVREGIMRFQGNDYNAVMVTQSFGRTDSTPARFLAGVAYYDLNGNGQYDPGEGIPGVEVRIAGNAYRALTSSSGGYAVPVPEETATRTVSFVATGLNASTTIAFEANGNAKLDWRLNYTPPAVLGPAAPIAGLRNAYEVTLVAGATAYEVQMAKGEPALPDNADHLERVVDGTNPSYNALSSSIKYNGAAAYRFAHPSPNPDETLTYSAPFIAGPAARMTFESRLGWATSGQHATVQVSTNDGMSWVTVYERAGTSSAGETSFRSRSVQLAAFSGEKILIRFNYRYSGGLHYPQTSDDVGWYVDAVAFEDMEQTVAASVSLIDSSGKFSLVPEPEENYYLVAKPLQGNKPLPPGPVSKITARAATGFAAWAIEKATAAGADAAEMLENPMADSSGDGVSNILAYALDLNPFAPSSHLMPKLDRGPHGLVFGYWHRSGAEDVRTVPEVSTDLIQWHPVGDPGMPVPVQDEFVGETDGMVFRRLVIPDNPYPAVFARLRVTMQ